MDAGRDTGGGWAGFVAIAVVIMTVLGGVLLSMADARQAVSVSLVTSTPTMLSLPQMPTASPTTEVVTYLPSPTWSVPTPYFSEVTPIQQPTAKPTLTQEPQPSSTPEVVLASCTPPSGWVPITVELGDTVSSLATRSQVSAEAAREANCLSTDLLYPGSVIYLPALPAQPAPDCGPPTDWLLYTVKRGDTLYSLATGRGVTVAEVLAANCLASASISAGVGLYLPPAVELPATEVASPTPGIAGPPGTVCLISSPADGSQVSGALTLLGSATTERFLFYKIEVSGPQTGENWASLLGQTVHTAVEGGVLGSANLGGWQPGEYLVRLVIVDTTSNEVGVCYLGLEVLGS